MMIYPIGTSEASIHACRLLSIPSISFTDHPCPEITHLMLDVPSFGPDGLLRDGRSIERTLSMIPQNTRIIGGNLNIPCLEGYTKLDLLQDPIYLAANAKITADCALRLCAGKLKTTFSDTPALVIGRGRIGKCLARMLREIGSPVTVCARKVTDRAMICALGYNACAIEEISGTLKDHSLIFNTVPATLPDLHLPEGILAYELASIPGLPADQAVAAGGLPGKLAPYSSGKLIADTIFRLCKEDMS